MIGSTFGLVLTTGLLNLHPPFVLDNLPFRKKAPEQAFGLKNRLRA